ncbi:hypothetical protein VPH35_024641 [Triticum aestivum]
MVCFFKGDHCIMGNVEQHLENATPTTLLHYQLSDMWRSPRGTVLRIEGLALVGITCSFFLVAFGSCRRWSNSWIIQKGFLAAQVLSLSLGTYSIGLMQSSSVKSEMYPIWAVSLLTLFGCVDPITTYIGLEYKGPLLKIIFQLCLYCGYVLLMSVSTISGVVGKLAIGVLSAITFIKGFHMSLALVQPSRARDKLAEFHGTAPIKVVRKFNGTEIGTLAGDSGELQVHLPVYHLMQIKKRRGRKEYITTSMADIHSSCKEMMGNKLQLKEVTANGIEDVCLGYSLSHLLQRRFLGLDTPREMELKIEKFEHFAGIGRAIDYKRILNAIEVELAFLYEVFFTSNEFLHYHEARDCSFWAFASFVGICFVGVATAIPGAMSSHHHITGSNSPGASTIVVNTRTADLTITLVILVSLALLQLVQLMRCWTSNWALVAFACEYAREENEYAMKQYKQAAATADPESWGQISSNSQEKQISWWVRLKAFVVTRMNWFDKYLWQDKLGQYSLVDEATSRKRKCGLCTSDGLLAVPCGDLVLWFCRAWPGLRQMFGLQYIGQVIRELWACDTSTTVRLHDDVKASIADFLGKIKSRRIGVEWSSLFHGQKNYGINVLAELRGVTKSDAYAFSHRVMVWHIATCCCEEVETQEGSTGGGGGGGSSDDTRERNRRVAMALSRYCAYLVVSAPELLPGPSMETKRAHKDVMFNLTHFGFKSLRGVVRLDPFQGRYVPREDDALEMGVYWGMRLLNECPPPPGCTPRRRSDDHWEMLALLWVQTLLYAAPYGDMQRHMQHLSQGGEFITHLWALLYHIGIDRWDGEPAQAAAGETREAAQAQGDTSEAEIEVLN